MNHTSYATIVHLLIKLIILKILIMKIKKIAYILCGLLLVSCNDSFLERYPDTDMSDKTYITSEKDLELYTNTFYN